MWASLVTLEIWYTTIIVGIYELPQEVSYMNHHIHGTKDPEHNSIEPLGNRYSTP